MVDRDVPQTKEELKSLIEQRIKDAFFQSRFIQMRCIECY